MRRAMNWARENADRSLSANPPSDSGMTKLRDLLKTGEIADYDGITRMRVGAAISNAVFDPSKPNG
jgi:hypothetical protein